MSPLFSAEYGTTVVPPWQSEQQPSVNGVVQDRITVVAHAQLPGVSPYKPKGGGLRVELRPYNGGAGDVQGGQYNRAEVYTRHGDISKPASAWPDPPGSTRWYGLSVFVPVGFVPSSNWLTLLQLKGYDGGSPPIALELKNNSFRFGGTRTNSGLIPNDGELRPYTPGTWHQIVFGVKYAFSVTEGWVEAWLNGAWWVKRQALSTLDVINGQPDRMYLKEGIYRSTAWTTTSVLHFGPTVVGQYRTEVEDKLRGVLA